MKLFVLSLILLSSLALSAQPPAANALIEVAPTNSRSKTVDGKFVALLGLAGAMTVLDVQLTQRCLSAGTCHEVNPIYGTNPTAQRMYGISFGMLGSEVLISHWLRKHHPNSSAWIAPLAVSSASHGVGAISGAVR